MTDWQRKHQDYLRTTKWQQVQEYVQQRDNYCQFAGCGLRFGTPGIIFDVHHICYDFRYQMGLPMEAEICQLLCHYHHEITHHRNPPIPKMSVVDDWLDKFLYEYSIENKEK